MYQSEDNQTQSSEEEAHYFETPSGEGSWASEWSRYDPNTLWTGIWTLWMEDGIRIILGYEQHCHERIEHHGEDSSLSQFSERWPRLRSSLQWRFY